MGGEDGVHPDLPKGAFTLFLSGKTQEICGVVQDEDVTEEVPYKMVAVETIKQDMFKRAAVCDFSAFKDKINSYPEEEILIVFDADFEYGNNFYFAATVEARDEIMKKFQPSEEGGDKKPKKEKKEKVEGDEGVDVQEESEEESEDEFAGQVFEYKPPEAKIWEHLGSEKEILEEQFVPSRKKIQFVLSRPWKEFGAEAQFATTNTLFKEETEGDDEEKNENDHE